MRTVPCEFQKEFMFRFFLPPANEVWGKVIFSEVCVSHSVHGGEGEECVCVGCMAGGACMVGGMCGRGHAWQGGVGHVAGGHVW